MIERRRRLEEKMRSRGTMMGGLGGAGAPPQLSAPRRPRRFGRDAPSCLPGRLRPADRKQTYGLFCLCQSDDPACSRRPLAGERQLPRAPIIDSKLLLCRSAHQERPARAMGVRFSLLSVAVVLCGLMLKGCMGCLELCSIDGCPGGEVCSLATERCMDPSDVYGPPCPLGPSQCHREVCLQLPAAEGGPTCTGTCEEGDPPCPESFRCLPASDGMGGTTLVCVPRGEGAIGDPCVTDADCFSRLCLPMEPEPFCSDFCEEDPSICGEGNVACLTLVDMEDNLWELCVKGGDSGPGEPCPDGIVDCDLTQTEICLADDRISFCSVGCPDGPEDCDAFPGGCCVDLGASDEPEDHFCLPREYCPCEPQCFGRNCGPDGCGGVCGLCDEGQVCENGLCVDCTPDCADAECGPDGCGGLCGSCDPGEQCVEGTCLGTCNPECEGRECGPDGCGGLCGVCTSPDRCHDGSCVDPALLLIDLLVSAPLLEPEALWGLGEYRNEPSIGPLVTYGQGPQAGTTQVALCGETVACNEETALELGTSYSLRLGFRVDGDLVRCVASFVLEGEGEAIVDGADCVIEGGGPFEAIVVTGPVDAPVIGWELP